MKALVVNDKKIGTILPILGFVFLFSLVSTTVLASETEFEIGTQFGISYLRPVGDSSTTRITYTRFPSGTFFDVGSAPTSLYATLFPSQQFAIGPEFSFGRTSVSEEYWEERETESITTLHLGGKASYFLLSHEVSSPYLFGRVSLTMFSGYDDDQTLTSFGAGAGYQWRIDTAFVLRAEGQYQRLLVSDDDDANEFSLTIGIGTRFGNNNNPQ